MPKSELVRELRIRVNWPDRCSRCGRNSAPARRNLQLDWVYPDPEGYPEIEYVWIALPLCDACGRHFRSPIGLVSRIFPAWHKVATVIKGSPVFTNSEFDAESCA